MITATATPVAREKGARLNTAYIWTISLVAALGGLLGRPAFGDSSKVQSCSKRQAKSPSRRV